MKRTFCKLNILLLINLVFVSLTSCNDDTTTSSTTTTYEYSLTATIDAMDGYEGTGDFLSGVWKSDEEIALVDITYSGRKKVIMNNASAQSTAFSGTSTSAFLDEDEVIAFYPASALEMATSDTLTQKLNINGQEGTLESCKKHLFYIGDSVIELDNSVRKATVSLSPLMAIADMKFTYNGASLNKIKEIYITDANSELYSAYQYSLSSQEWKSGLNSVLSIKNDNGIDGNAMIAMFPADNLSLQFMLKTVDGNMYQASCHTPVSFVAGQTTSIADIVCTPYNMKAHVGDYLYDDNTWSQTLDENKSCVGIIYTLCDADGTPNPTLTDGVFGRAVALKDVSSSTYIWSSAGEFVEGRDSIKTADGTNESIELSAVTDYTSGAAANYELLPYSARLVSSYYRANQICYNYTAGRKGVGSWYLPSAGDLVLIYKMSEYNSFTAVDCFNELKLGAYWSSTIYGKNLTWAINTHSGMLYPNSKVSSYYVRAITTF